MISLASDSDPRWYALTVKPQHERAVAAALRNRGLEEFLPLYRSERFWSDRIKQLELPLFPRYVFCWFCYEDRLPVLKTPGVLSIVRFGKVAAPAADQEIADLKALVNSRLPLARWPWLKVGERIHIQRGPLRGLEGILLRIKDSWRVIVSVSLLQRSVAVEIDHEYVSPAGIAGSPTSQGHRNPVLPDHRLCSR